MEYPLREKKYAKTKIALVNEFIERLKTNRFSDISIKEVCDSLEVSEGTFYNYFPHKYDLLSYFERLTLLKIMWGMKDKEKKLDSLGLIEYVFDCLARDIEQPFLFYEIISVFTTEKIKPGKGEDLTEAEKYYAFPDCNGIEQVKLVSLEDLFVSIIERAQNSGDILKSINVKEFALTLVAIMVGLPLAIEMDEFDKLSTLFRNQLIMLWKAVGAKRK